MLSVLVGNVDIPAAAVLVAGFGYICIITTSLIIKRRSRTDVANEFALMKMRQEAETAGKIYQLETDRQFKFKQIEHNLITSHERQ